MWIKEILDATKESESPERFRYWTSVCAISAVLRKNVYIDRHFYKLYPNIYVILVARSGLRKGQAISLCKSLVEYTNATRVISGRNSIQFMLKDLSKAYTTEEGSVIHQAHGFIVTGEFASFLVRDPDAMTILTDLYDTHAHEKGWVNSLKTTGVEHLKAPCITLLGATNETHFADLITANDVEGGFIARTFIVHEDQKRCINPLIEPPERKPTTEEFGPYLKELSKVSGEVKLSKAAANAYAKWYESISESDIPDPTGTMERIHDSVLKVSMILALAEDLNKLVVEKHHFEEAVEESLKCVIGMKRVTMGQGKSTLATSTRLVLQELLRRPDNRIERSKLLRKYWGQFDAMELDRVIETLEGAGAVNVYRSGSNVIYSLKPSVVEEYLGYKSLYGTKGNET